MNILGREKTILFFNSLLHGLDITSIIKMNVSILDAAFGIILTFILGWLFGVSISLIYNFSLKSINSRKDKSKE